MNKAKWFPSSVQHRQESWSAFFYTFSANERSQIASYEDRSPPTQMPIACLRAANPCISHMAAERDVCFHTRYYIQIVLIYSLVYTRNAATRVNLMSQCSPLSGKKKTYLLCYRQNCALLLLLLCCCLQDELQQNILLISFASTICCCFICTTDQH
jgi:hypothetical protein